MTRECNCRTAQLCAEHYITPIGELSVIEKRHLKCRFCNSSIWHCHNGDDRTSDFVLECNACHNYILYYKNSNLKSLRKEELFADNYCVIIYSDKTVSIWDMQDNMQKCIVGDLPIFKITSKDQLLNKIKTILSFA